MTESEKIERLQKALKNARKRIESQQVHIEALEKTLAKYSHICIEIDEHRMASKKGAIERECIYGLTHFCDGTVNEEEAGDGTRPLPPCPLRRTCRLREMRIEREGEQ